MRPLLFAASLGVLGHGAMAEEFTERDAFIEANVLGIFYHELAHAIIDVMDVPIFGQEEDAADVASTLLIDWFYEEEAAQNLAFYAAFGYINDPDGVEEVAYWDLHGPDEQRFYNHICIFYGGNPDVREELALDLGLPEERADTCPDEYDQAVAAWGSVFDEIEAEEGFPIVFEGDGSFASEIMAAEIEAMNGELTFPQQITARVESCGEANAFYDPNDVSITFCTEFEDHLATLFDAFFEES